MSFPNNKFREGLGFSPEFTRVVKKDATICPIQEVFRSGGFVHPTPP